MKLLTLAIAVLTLTVFGDRAPVHAAGGPKAVVLRHADVPRGFAQVAAVSRPNSQVKGFSKSFVSRTRRVGGYEVAFQNPASKGICCILNEAIQFRTASGAKTYYRSMRKHSMATYHGVSLANGTADMQATHDPSGRLVLICTAVRDAYIVQTEIHYRAGSATQKAMLKATLKYEDIALFRVP
jgi:hypothetical protein